MSNEAIMSLFVLALSVAAISITICKAKIFENFRESVSKRNMWLGKLISCPYCTSHWVSLAAVIIYRPSVFQSVLWPVDVVISAFAIVALAMPISWVIYKSFKGFDDSASEESGLLRSALLKAKAKIEEQDRVIRDLLKT